MNRYRWLLRIVGVSMAFPLLDCGSSVATCASDETCAPTLDGGTGDEGAVDTGADVVQPPVGCDPLAEPKDAPKCVVSDFGVFVDANSGADANAGTKDAPVKTIGGALGKLGAKTRVYVCEGTYAEHVKLTSAVSLYGGFACGAWTYSGTKAKVGPADAGYALQVGNVSSPVILTDLVFTAIPGTDAAPSSIAAFVTNTTSLTLRRVDLVAGAGFKGKTPDQSATLALMSSMPTAGTLNGNAGSATVGGAAQLCTCTGGGTSKGGGGGNLNGDGSVGTTAQASPEPASATGLGNTFADCNSGTQLGGKPGSNAPPAASAAGATTLGVLAESGWTPASGSDAAPGTPGQGGGGGGGAGGGGGSGACGGCGGEGGKAGGGGGASIALATVSSPVSLIASSLTAADAGAGGAGGAGGDGAAGGVKGVQGGGACPGGNGGKGGNGGGGGGGAGGLSAGVLYKGAKPILDATKVTTGAFGTKGIGAGLDGIDGQKADVLEAQ